MVLWILWLVFTIPSLICTGKKLNTRSSDRAAQHRNSESLAAIAFGLGSDHP